MRVSLVVLVCAVAAGHFGLMRLCRVEPPRARAEAAAGISVVVRTARNVSPDGRGVGALVERLAAMGVTHVIAQFKQDESDEVEGGLVFFPSAVAPVVPGYEADPLRTLIAACAERGIRVSGWMPTLHDPAAVRAHPEWGASWLAEDEVRVDPQPEWLCPRAVDAIDYEAAILGEIARNYPELDSLYIDFIRYDGDRSCACARCLDAWGGDAAALEAATHERGRARPWRRWVERRADAIASVVERLAVSTTAARPDLWLGAFVLPFSATSYDDDTQTGQDYARLAAAGLDELVVLGYWDDWGKAPGWTREQLDGAREQLDGACELAVALDADQSVLRTRLTLDALVDCPEDATWFEYGTWTDERCRALRTALDARERMGSLVAPEWFDVAIRIDTEPDADRRYDTLDPAMITTLVLHFDAAAIPATFVTCGRLLELEPKPLLAAHAAGHEIAVHAYDHEQLDALTDDEQTHVLERAAAAFATAGLVPRGFAAPRNGITAHAREVLLAQGYAWDGSEAYEPTHALLDPWEVTGAGRSLIVLPFAMPNDWDARVVEGIDAAAMEQRWLDGLDAALASGSPFFVLDVHQWLVTRPDNLAALDRFIAAAKSRPGVRFVTCAAMAEHARERLVAAADVAARAPSAAAPTGDDPP